MLERVTGGRWWSLAKRTLMAPIQWQFIHSLPPPHLSHASLPPESEMQMNGHPSEELFSESKFSSLLVSRWDVKQTSQTECNRFP